MLAWHVREGHYGDVRLDGFSLVALGEFEGNIWAGEAKPRMGFFVDERADERQRMALQTIFGGQAGGWPAGFAALIAEMRGFEFVPITFEVAGDLAFWRAEIPGRVVGRAEALTGPTTPPGKRVQLVNPPGSEVGPGQVATWGRSVEIRASGFRLQLHGPELVEQAHPVRLERARLSVRGRSCPGLTRLPWAGSPGGGCRALWGACDWAFWPPSSY